MQYKILGMTLLIATGLSAGCAPSEGAAADKANRDETVSMERDKVKTEMKETAQAMQDYTYAQKAEFVTATKKELDEIQVELDRLTDRVARSKGDAKAAAEIKLTEVREAWAQTKEQLGQAENATEDAWNDVKRSVQKSRDGLKESFEQSRQWLSDKIEP